MAIYYHITYDIVKLSVSQVSIRIEATDTHTRLRQFIPFEIALRTEDPITRAARHDRSQRVLIEAMRL